MRNESRKVINTVIANCQDCYRCVRSCPVKAIKIANGQAHVINHLCIDCGACIRECPKHAKVTVSQVEAVKELISSNQPVIASVASSFAARFTGWRRYRLPSALRRLGFSHVAETAEGAALVGSYTYEESLKHPVISSTCPAVVSYIEKYKPEYLPFLAPVASPMVMHGRILRKRYGENCKVVFIGTCPSKKQEMFAANGPVDAVITFQELEEWLEKEKINLSACPESGFESYGDITLSRLYSISGGLLRSCQAHDDVAEGRVLRVSGFEELRELLSIPPAKWPYRLVEALFCRDGCVNGPCFGQNDESLFIRQQQVLEHSKNGMLRPADEACRMKDYQRSFSAKPVDLSDVSEEDILRVYEMTDKTDLVNRPNCGACGYDTCREHAIATIRGMAGPEMCMPYMRRMAQQRTDIILDTSPNGVVLLDSDLNILRMNQSFRRMFGCGEEIGRHISCVIDPAGFEKLAMGNISQYEAILTEKGRKYHEFLYILPQVEEKQLVGIFIDISRIKADSAQLDLIKRQTVRQAKELLDHQIKFSQEMAHFLGRSTARNEKMVKQLIDLYEFGEDSADEQ